MAYTPRRIEPSWAVSTSSSSTGRSQPTSPTTLFLRLWEHYGRLPAGSNEKAWLIRVATNLAISHRRSQGAAWRRHVAYQEPADPGLQALNNLELVRAVISLRFDGGLGFAEIGTIVGNRENTVKTRFHRSLDKLRRQLGDANPFVVNSQIKDGSNG